MYSLYNCNSTLDLRRGNLENNQLDLQPSAEDDESARSESQYSQLFSRLRGHPEINQLDLQPSAEDDERARSESQYSPSFSRLRGNLEINQLDLQYDRFYSFRVQVVFQVLLSNQYL